MCIQFGKTFVPQRHLSHPDVSSNSHLAPSVLLILKTYGLLPNLTKQVSLNFIIHRIALLSNPCYPSFGLFLLVSVEQRAQWYDI